MSDLLELADVTVQFPKRGTGGLFWHREHLNAVDGVSLAIKPGETVGLIGESGSGKTTLGYTIAGRYRPTSGSVRFEGAEVAGATGRTLRDLRSDIQMIFQDPFTALNPRRSIGDSVAEPLLSYRRFATDRERTQRVSELLELCGLPASMSDRLPSAFSGGQRQRIGIARALALNPKLVIADEPTSALDVSIQAQIINLLRSLQGDLGVSYLFISHNLAVVRHIAHRVAIMYRGQIVEVATTAEIFDNPQHPYTKALLAAEPTGAAPIAKMLPENPGVCMHLQTPEEPVSDGEELGS
jgi:ABC-type oligopeptide transport system ATPase subunit